MGSVNPSDGPTAIVIKLVISKPFRLNHWFKRSSSHGNMSSVRNQSVKLSKLVSQTDLVNQLAIHPKAVSQTVSYTANQPGTQLDRQSASQPFSQLDSQSAISLWRFLDGIQEVRHCRPSWSKCAFTLKSVPLAGLLAFGCRQGQHNSCLMSLNSPIYR